MRQLLPAIMSRLIGPGRDDYYLAEGTGIAERLTVDAQGRVVVLSPIDGEHYQAWVAGVDPDTGRPRGGCGTTGRRCGSSR